MSKSSAEGERRAVQILFARCLLMAGLLSGLAATTCSRLHANMASPVHPGSLTGVPFTSHSWDILQQKIKVRLTPDFLTARFIVDYYIATEKYSPQVPIVFYALQIRNNFHVTVDGTEIPLLGVNPDSALPATLHFMKEFPGWDSGYVRINGGSSGVTEIPLNALRYFEVTLDPGRHHIHVEYDAAAWVDRSDWLKTYRYLYLLEPARHWKSYGGLDIEVHQTGAPRPLTYSIGKPHQELAPVVALWSFSELPADVFEIRYAPETPRLAAALIRISPAGMALGVFVLLVLLHGLLIYHHRRRHYRRKISSLSVVGSLLVPFITISVYVFSFSLIDALIGPEASGNHGYPFLAYLLYPVFMPVYGIVMILGDWLEGRRRRKSGN